MRRKINNDLKKYLLDVEGQYTIDELVEMVNKRFKERYDRKSLRNYMLRNRIQYKYVEPSMKRDMGKYVKLGTEHVEKDGKQIIIKVDKNRWIPKQRYIYEKHYGVRLRDDEYIVFLNHDRNDFRIENLRKITREEATFYASNRLFFENAELTKVGVEIARLKAKTKGIQNEK